MIKLHNLRVWLIVRKGYLDFERKFPMGIQPSLWMPKWGMSWPNFEAENRFHPERLLLIASRVHVVFPWKHSIFNGSIHPSWALFWPLWAPPIRSTQGHFWRWKIAPMKLKLWGHLVHIVLYTCAGGERFTSWLSGILDPSILWTINGCIQKLVLHHFPPFLTNQKIWEVVI